MTTSEMFTDFLANLKINNAASITSKYEEIASALNKKFRPLALCALDYAKEGVTSLDEVFRISASLGDGG